MTVVGAVREVKDGKKTSRRKRKGKECGTVAVKDDEGSRRPSSLILCLPTSTAS